MAKDTLIRLLVESDVVDRYKQYCKGKGISISDDIRDYIISTLSKSKNSERGEKNPRGKSIFGKGIRFTNAGLIENPKTVEEIEYNRSMAAKIADQQKNSV